MSTTKAEYIAATEACKEAIWLARLVRDLGIAVEMPTLHCDSQNAILLAKNPIFHAKTKHIEVKYHFIREMLEDKLMKLVKVHKTCRSIDQGSTSKAICTLLSTNGCWLDSVHYSWLYIHTLYSCPIDLKGTLSFKWEVVGI